MSNFSLRIDDELTCDLLVIGGGIAAICAAIAAARNGCDTVLIEMDELLGGNSSPLLGVHVSGAHSFHPYASETGIIEEIELEAARQAAKTRTPMHHYNLSNQWDLVLAQKLREAGVRVFRRHQGRRALVDGPRVTGVIVEDIQHFRTRLFHVRHGIIDGSGDGEVAADAGAAFMRGTEGKDVFGERSGFPVSVPDTMGTSLTAFVVKRDAPVEFVMPPEFAARRMAEGPYQQLPGTGMLHLRGDGDFLWVTENGGERETIADDAEIRREILYQLYCWWDNVKNFSFPEQTSRWDLLWVSPKSGKRESRRFIGDLVLTQTDVEEARVFDDAIGYGGYGVDVHEVNGLTCRIVFYSVPPLWSFPYRAAYARDFDNLWLVGRLMSVSHLALGTLRLMRTMGGIGQGVGIAAALAQRFGCTAREIYTEHRETLQQTLLRQDGTILTAINTDPTDLARAATVTAGSEMPHGAMRVTDYLPLDILRGVQLWDWAPELRAVNFAVRNTTGDPQRLTVRLLQCQRQQLWKDENEFHAPEHIDGNLNRMEWGTDNTLAAFHPLETADSVVPAGFDGWVEFRFPTPITMLPVNETSDDNRYNLLLDPCPGVDIGVDRHAYDFALRLWHVPGEERAHVAADCHAFRLDPAPRYGEAVNVIDGHSRRYATNPVHLWLSDFDQPLPQHLTLTFPHPATVARVHLTFDTLERSYFDTPINADQRYDPRCASSYRLELLTPTGWQEVAADMNNYQRHRMHTFAPLTAQALRLTVLAVRDERYRARVYEIRAYGEEEQY